VAIKTVKLETGISPSPGDLCASELKFAFSDIEECGEKDIRTFLLVIASLCLHVHANYSCHLNIQERFIDDLL
jgi:hypothetical protein